MDTVPASDAGRLPRARTATVASVTPPGTNAGPGAPADWSHRLRAVLAGIEQHTLVAQPIAELGAGLVVGYELLSRFAGPLAAPPDVWFAEADRHGYGAALTVRAVERALLARPHLPYGTFLTVNVHPHLLVHQAVQEALLDWGRLDRVVVELTGSAGEVDPRMLRAALDQLREAGAMVALDEAGTGEGAVRQLLLLQPDIIRVDRALIGGIDTDPARRAVVQALGSLGGRVAARVLAEGVETPAELRTLAELGVPLGQGWLVGRPAPQWPRVDPALRPRLRRVNRWTTASAPAEPRRG